MKETNLLSYVVSDFQKILWDFVFMVMRLIGLHTTGEGNLVYFGIVFFVLLFLLLVVIVSLFFVIKKILGKKFI